MMSLKELAYGRESWPSLGPGWTLGLSFRQAWWVLVALSLGLSLTSCRTLGLSLSSGDTEDTVIEQITNQRMERSARGSILVSKMLPVRLRLRRGWQAAPANKLHNNADLQAYNPAQNIFLLVLGESNTSVSPGTLEDQASRYLDLLKRALDRVIAPQVRTGVDRVSGFPAVQYELRGEILGQSVAYLHTTIEMHDHYYQVLVWTPDDLHVANSEEMQAIVQEFGPDQL